MISTKNNKKMAHYTPRTSFCGSHFLIITFCGLLGKLSDSNFHKTLYGNSAKVDIKVSRTLSGIFILWTFEPKLKYTTPSFDESKSVCKS